ncbi:MAG: tRNA (N6-isopentenyl adenosine(37)-C2)-methylthiotransferase MiaB [Acidobacteriota bacterium]
MSGSETPVELVTHPGAELDDELASPRPQEPGERGSYLVQTWGCQMNVHDSERMAGLLQSIGFREASSENDADLILLNTCTVRENAADKLRGRLGQLRELKRQRPHVILGVCGCLAQQERDGLFADAPHLDLVLGPRAIPQLPKHVRSLLEKREQLSDTAPWTSTVGEGSELALRKSFPKAYLTVQEGCDKFCTFCVVPFTRGREKCRPLQVLLSEVEAVAGRGFREVELLGQNVNCYQDGEGNDFADLILACAEVEGIERVRFVTSHPRHFGDRIVEAMGHPNIADALHLPVQSGSDRVLSAMRREYRREDYLDRISALRRVCPDIALWTDLIVGFPGETEEDFAETLSLVEEVGYEALYAFKYSPRPFTRASKQLEDNVPEEVKSERLSRLFALQDRLSTPRDRARVGRIEEVLVDGTSKRSDRDLAGRTSRNRVVNFPGEPELIGQILPLRITEAKAHSFRGEIAGSPR